MHSKFQEWLILAQYDELSGREARLLQEHLASCPECQAEQRALQQMHRLVDRYAADVSDRMLDESRDSLHQRLHREAAQTAGALRYKTPLLIAASLLIGFFTGALAIGIGVLSVSEPTLLADSEVRFTDLDFVDSDPSDGSLEVHFRAVKPVRFAANLKDPLMQRLVSQALREGDNPGVRLTAVSALGENLLPGGDTPVQRALLETVMMDPNPGVRTQALHVLGQLPFDEQIQKALVHVLINDSNSGNRVAAINLLHQSMGKAGRSLSRESLGLLEERLTREQNDFIRQQSRALIREVQFQ